MNKNFLTIGALFGALGVILGALGAHQLKDHISAYHLEIFEKGVHFQLFHAIALLCVGILSEKIQNKLINTAGWLMTAGVVFFSGSLYLLATMEINGLDGMQKIIGPITPIGGLCFISGWLLLLISVRK